MIWPSLADDSHHREDDGERLSWDLEPKWEGLHCRQKLQEGGDSKGLQERCAEKSWLLDSIVKVQHEA
jgi:hypothetical protein